MVLTSHDQLGDTGERTGFWLEEFAAPFYAFVDAGAEVTIASPAGGEPPVDPASLDDDAMTEATRRYMDDSVAQERVAKSAKLCEIDVDDFDAVFYPGGHGPLWDLTGNEDSIALIEHLFADGRPVAAVCHAPTVLLNAEAPGGVPLVQGHEVTGFSNAEEEAVGLADTVPFLLEDELKGRGGSYSKADRDFAPHVVVDGNLVTGQNPASSERAANAVLKALNAQDD